MKRMSVIIANSNNVQQRIRTYLDKDSIVVYPPCDVDACRWLGQEDGYYLSTARLEPHKRVDIVVEAFRRMPDRKLLVASGGSELTRLQRLADGARNIDFTGWVDTDRLRELIGRAIATIYVPRDEDFGISPVESMAAGKPVIGVAEGGLLETVVEGQTGLLLPPDPGAEELMEAVLSMDTDRALSMREACERRAQAFRVELFLDRMREIVHGEPGSWRLDTWLGN
jgi:glycosyltransferase involved in cell wall biosynthesis